MGQAYRPYLQEFTAEDGLSNANISAIWTDSRGMVWIGTEYGLNRFDGQHFKSYTVEEHGLCDNRILKINEDRQGNLWILGGEPENKAKRICILNPITEEVLALEAFIKGGVPFNLDNTVLFDSHLNSIIFREDRDERYRFYRVKDRHIEVLFDLSKKDYTLGASDQMMEQTDGTFVTTFQPDTANSQVGGFAFFKKNGTFIKKETKPLNAFPTLRTDGMHLFFQKNEHKGKQTTVRLSMDGDTLGEVVINNKEEIYTYSAGSFARFRYDGISFYQPRFNQLRHVKYFYDAEVLPSGNRLFSDLGNGVWYTKGTALLRLNVSAQHFYTIFNDDSPNSGNVIQGIHTTFDSKHLYATSLDYLYGVQFLDGKREKIRVLRDSLQMGNLTNILVEDSIVWIATAQDGLAKYNFFKKEFVHFDQASNMDSKAQLKKVYRASNGQLWIGANQGLLLLDTLAQKLVPFQGYHSDFPDLERSQVNAFYDNAQGTWLATSSGVYLLDLTAQETLAYYSSSQKGAYHIPADNITHLHEDSSGIFWLSTIAQGLVRWDSKREEHQVFTKANSGLPTDILYGVHEDEFNQLWMPSNQGLICFDKTTFQHKAFYKADGLSYTEFNALAHHQGRDGRLYFGSPNGMLFFYPESFNTAVAQDSLQVIEVVKTKVENNELVNVLPQFLKKGTIDLLSEDKFVSIRLVIPNYNYPKGKQYSYRLVGYHDDWVYQTEPDIHLSGFPYGKYELQIRGKVANSKEWVTYPDTIRFHTVKPIYLRWWFIGLVLLALAALVYALIQRNTRQLLKRQEELETIVEERTAQIRKDKTLIEEQAEELRTLDKVKSNFFANVSHELRTPLTLILGPLSYLLDNPAAWDKQEVQQQLTVMQRNGKSLLHLVEEILDLSKLEAHKLELQEEPTSVVTFFEHLFIVFEPQFQNEQLDYELQFELYEDDVFVLLDRKKIKKVVNNFLSNAIKFTPKRGKVSLSIIETDTLLQIKVTDTGKGVHPKDLPFIFERFYQSKQADQKLYGGTGIGLALVSEFASLMGGQAYAESELGRGSRFYFDLPKQVTKAFHISPTTDETSNEELALIDSIGTDFTILVVEDNPDMRTFVCDLLSKHYTVLSAVNGIEGLAVLRKSQQTIHLIVSDVMMPEMDGLEMLKVIKSDAQWSSIPVVMLTALAGERDKLNALTIGVDDYLTKPFSVTELLTRVQNLLYNYHQRQQWQSATTPEEKDNGQEANTPSEKQEEATQPALNPLNKEWIDRAREMVEASLTDEVVIKVEEIAQKHHLSIRQFNRKMKSLTGLSAARFIREVQLERGRKILEDGLTLSVSEVAYRCGFEYPSTFSNLFKKRYGKSPVEFLKGVGG